VTLSVTYFASYLTTMMQWRDSDYSASMFVKAIKGKSFNGYGHLRVRDVSQRFTSGDSANAKKWFAQMAGDYLKKQRMNPEATWGLIPFPSREALVGVDPAEYASRDLAELLKDELLKTHKFQTVQVVDVVRWTERRPSAHDEGGPRTVAGVHPYLTVTAKPTLDFYVLIDDVLTSGARLTAAAARLKEAKFHWWMAVTAGRTVRVQPDDPFEVRTEDLPEYEPVD
jgi:hypothetical protein